MCRSSASAEHIISHERMNFRREYFQPPGSLKFPVRILKLFPFRRMSYILDTVAFIPDLGNISKDDDASLELET